MLILDNLVRAPSTFSEDSDEFVPSSPTLAGYDLEEEEDMIDPTDMMDVSMQQQQHHQLYSQMAHPQPCYAQQQQQQQQQQFHQPQPFANHQHQQQQQQQQQQHELFVPSSELIEPTKLTAKQIKHALPSWMFNDIVDDPLPDKRTPKKTRRGCRAKKNKDKANNNRMAMENDMTMLGNGSSISLSKCIASLPAELQRCFTEWRRERKQAIMNSDIDRQNAIETIMWSAIRNIMSSQREKENMNMNMHQAHYYYY